MTPGHVIKDWRSADGPPHGTLVTWLPRDYVITNSIDRLDAWHPTWPLTWPPTTVTWLYIANLSSHVTFFVWLLYVPWPSKAVTWLLKCLSKLSRDLPRKSRDFVACTELSYVTHVTHPAITWHCISDCICLDCICFYIIFNVRVSPTWPLRKSRDFVSPNWAVIRHPRDFSAVTWHSLYFRLCMLNSMMYPRVYTNKPISNVICHLQLPIDQSNDPSHTSRDFLYTFCGVTW